MNNDQLRILIAFANDRTACRLNKGQAQELGAAIQAAIDAIPNDVIVRAGVKVDA